MKDSDERSGRPSPSGATDATRSGRPSPSDATERERFPIHDARCTACGDPAVGAITLRSDTGSVVTVYVCERGHPLAMLLLGLARRPGRLRVETSGHVPAKVGLSEKGMPTRLALLDALALRVCCVEDCPDCFVPEPGLGGGFCRAGALATVADGCEARPEYLPLDLL